MPGAQWRIASCRIVLFARQLHGRSQRAEETGLTFITMDAKTWGIWHVKKEKKKEKKERRRSLLHPSHFIPAVKSIKWYGNLFIYKNCYQCCNLLTDNLSMIIEEDCSKSMGVILLDDSHVGGKRNNNFFFLFFLNMGRTCRAVVNRSNFSPPNAALHRWKVEIGVAFRLALYCRSLSSIERVICQWPPRQYDYARHY